MNRPYLILPKLIEQPTWGGTYILQLKGWERNHAFNNSKIGQSYELYHGSRLALDVFDSSDTRFGPEEYTPDIQTNSLSMVDPSTKCSLLIKINQALGNSYQLHVRPGTQNTPWLPKPETWYFLENGYVTLGLRPDVDISAYKKLCLDIERFVLQTSKRVQNKTLSLDSARAEIQTYVRANSPRRFVQTHRIKKNEVVDLSAGGIHHSWEENTTECPQGNIIFELQKDVSDESSTIRSYDQGKLQDDGSARKLNIEDYFTYIDTDKQHNDIEHVRIPRLNPPITQTPYYSMHVLTLTDQQQFAYEGFSHYYVRDGAVRFEGGGISLTVSQGHSCYVPKGCEITIVPISSVATLIRSEQITN